MKHGFDGQVSGMTLRAVSPATDFSWSRPPARCARTAFYPIASTPSVNQTPGRCFVQPR
jgi:hypothetical protein